MWQNDDHCDGALSCSNANFCHVKTQNSYEELNSVDGATSGTYSVRYTQQTCDDEFRVPTSSSHHETNYTSLLFFAFLHFQCWSNTLYTTLTSRAIKKQLCGIVRFLDACLLPYRWQYRYITTVFPAFARNVCYGEYSVFIQTLFSLMWTIWILVTSSYSYFTTVFNYFKGRWKALSHQT